MRTIFGKLNMKNRAMWKGEAKAKASKAKDRGKIWFRNRE